MNCYLKGSYTSNSKKNAKIRIDGGLSVMTYDPIFGKLASIKDALKTITWVFLRP